MIYKEILPCYQYAKYQLQIIFYPNVMEVGHFFHPPPVEYVQPNTSGRIGLHLYIP